MNIDLLLKQKLIAAFLSLGLQLEQKDVVIETSKDPKFGDYATNICLKYANQLNIKPLVLAQTILPLLKDPIIDQVEIAGPGFLNFFIQPLALSQILSQILTTQDQFGQANLGQGQTINLEFVSANPTGPMHVAHARAAALGDVIAT